VIDAGYVLWPARRALPVRFHAPFVRGSPSAELDACLHKKQLFARIAQFRVVVAGAVLDTFPCQPFIRLSPTGGN
jgi:hypothetical protein